ncbi:sugar phosphate isomerase/epimerase family protein [Paenactinomyces guangxiensis]|uniref:Sugar phosphate isomerase/epimerase n=1 Tax=Paenactinomyces guangxiensis TaxID=1490290 RepID=A0A7W2A9Z1_9BACL|nr:sugar phosphate isomerase/epimerase family protein [Paenactinomyces guangxiensis]MBA4495393.1 sugar phosphate isomerase/epimerase [Paenactinomyces guangxiensis]MBH8592486.1 sugar phosphate isomerase/epimerase [Paenactinomyces guangxiensis]
MNISLSMWSVHKYWYEGRWDIVDFLDFASTTKVSGVELLSIFWRDQQRELPAVKEALRKYQLKAACYAAYNNFASGDSDKRKQQLKEVTDAVDMAVMLEAPVVRVFSGDLPEGNISYEQGLGYAVEGLARAAQYAEQKGVVLCLENHGLFAGRSGQVLDVINQVGSPALGSTFDTGNFLLVGQSPSDAIQELLGVIKHVHVKDFLHTPDETENVYTSLTGERYAGKIPGEGEVDLRYILGELQASGYDGWLSVEYEGSGEQREGAVRSVDVVYDLVQSVKSNKSRGDR